MLSFLLSSSFFCSDFHSLYSEFYLFIFCFFEPLWKTLMGEKILWNQSHWKRRWSALHSSSPQGYKHKSESILKGKYMSFTYQLTLYYSQGFAEDWKFVSWGRWMALTAGETGSFLPPDTPHLQDCAGPESL